MSHVVVSAYNVNKFFNKVFHLFEDVTQFLTWDDPDMNLTLLSTTYIFYNSFIHIGLNMWSLECYQEFSFIWPSDLVFNLR